MARVPITVMGFRCERCGYEWIPREPGREPKVCPNKECKSPYWDRPRTDKARGKSMTTYEEFKGQIVAMLAEAPEPGLTWTEIRTAARLPQAFPNNKWVHRLEQDIGLRRQRDEAGIIHWRLVEKDAPSESDKAS